MKLFIAIAAVCVSPALSINAAKPPKHHVPTGTYHGKASAAVVVKIEATISIVDSSHADVMVSVGGPMPLNISCKQEAFTVANDSGIVDLPGLYVGGDCLHDELKVNKIALQSLKYDSTADTIEIEGTKLIQFKILLKHQKPAGAINAAACTNNNPPPGNKAT